MKLYTSPVTGRDTDIASYFQDLRTHILNELDELTINQKISYLRNTYTYFKDDKLNHNDDRYLPACESFLLFLNEKINFYTNIEAENFKQSIWLKELCLFKDLYDILRKTGIINEEYQAFTGFFNLANAINFNLNIYNIVFLFDLLIEKGCLTELSYDNLVKNKLIFCDAGKKVNSPNKPVSNEKSILTLANVANAKKKIFSPDHNYIKCKELDLVREIFGKQIPISGTS